MITARIPPDNSVLLLAPVRVARRKDDETLLRQARGVTAVELECVARGVLVDDIRRQPFQAVLANDHWPAFPGLEVSGQ